MRNLKEQLLSESYKYIDVKGVAREYAIKPGLQSKFRANGVLAYYVLPGTKKIIYKRKDIEEFIESGKAKPTKEVTDMKKQ